MIILRNKYFSNEDNKDNSNLKTRIIGGGIAAGAGGLGAYVGNKIGQATAVRGQEGEVYKKYKGDLSGINSSIEREQQNLKNLRKNTHLEILNERRLRDESINKLNSNKNKRSIKNLFKKNKSNYTQELNKILHEHEINTSHIMRRGRQAQDPTIYNLRNLKKDRGIVEKVLKDRKTRGKWGSAIGAASAAGLAGAAYLGIKNKNKNR